jgi:hypothetical protein
MMCMPLARASFRIPGTHSSHKSTACPHISPYARCLIIADVQGFQAKNVDAIRSSRIVTVINTGQLRVKAFQIIFSEDGSLFINFPYFRHRIGLLCASALPADGKRQTDVNLEEGGKVASHLVKYSHHPDGRAHFSQTGKVITAVKRQSIPLDTQNNHIFTLHIQGLAALRPADAVKDATTSVKRAVIEFTMEPPDSVKFVGRWLDVSKMRFSNPTATIGPIVPMQNPDGVRTNSIFVASPHPNTRHVLAISCVPFSKLGSEPEMLMFYGGFDAPETMMDPTREGGFLAFIYPVSEVDNIRQRLGTVDYVPKS